MSSSRTDLNEFFALHPVFTVGEAKSFLREHRESSAKTHENVLAYHRKRGRIVPVRRGLYASVPPGVAPEDYRGDPYLLGSRMAPDAVLAYHTALELHGVAYSVHERRVLYLTGRSGARPHRWRGIAFQPVRQPRALVRQGQEEFGTTEVDRGGQPVRVTSLERTVVDCLDRPDRVGGWGEVWHSLDAVDYLDLDDVVEYALLLDNATTVAKTGFFLEAHRGRLGVQDADLERLEAHAPKGPHYLERGERTPGRLLGRWNLIVPDAVLDIGRSEWS